MLRTTPALYSSHTASRIAAGHAIAVTTSAALKGVSHVGGDPLPFG
ncbi:hypothetical protein [Rhodococcus olei]